MCLQFAAVGDWNTHITDEKPKLREAKGLAHASQLGSGTVWIQTQNHPIPESTTLTNELYSASYRITNF